jgi:hypothetical protein
MLQMDLERRLELVWKAATWLQLRKVEPALDLLETIAGPDLDEWSVGVRRGTARLRVAHAHIRRATAFEEQGDRDAASVQWQQADVACLDAVSGVPLGLTHRLGEMVFGLPDPWPHVVDGFVKHLEHERRHHSRDGLVGA